jgi:hypothetical protein
MMIVMLVIMITILIVAVLIITIMMIIIAIRVIITPRIRDISFPHLTGAAIGFTGQVEAWD